MLQNHSFGLQLLLTKACWKYLSPYDLADSKVSSSNNGDQVRVTLVDDLDFVADSAWLDLASQEALVANASVGLQWHTFEQS